MRRVHLSDDDLQSLEYACRAEAQKFKNDAKGHANPVLRNNARELANRYERLAERMKRFREVSVS
jgi:hypothetical protein